MRIASSEVYRQGVANLMTLQEANTKAQQQISTGKRILTPGDDPIGAARVVKLQQELSINGQYQRNIDVADARLSESESVLGQMLDVLQRVRELTLQAANGVNTPEDRQFLAAEISARFEELLALGNRRDASGSYLFSGFQGAEQPFRIEGSEVQFRGDSGQRFLQVDTGLKVAVSDSGRRLFQDAQAPATRVAITSVAGAEAELGGSLTVHITDQSQLDALYPEDLRIDIEPDADSGAATVTVRRVSDGRVVGGIDAMTYTPGMRLDVNGLALELRGEPKPGEHHFVETTPNRNVLAVIKDIADGLANPPDSPEAVQIAVERLTEDLLVGLDDSMNSILGVRAEIGARLNTLSSAKALHDTRSVQIEKVLSEVRDVDFAEAVSRLDYQSFVLQAAQQSFVRISNLSLFNVL